MMLKTLIAFAFVFSIFNSGTSQAQINTISKQLWATSIIRGNFGRSKKLEYYVEIQPRFNMDQPKNAQILIRPGLVLNLDDFNTLTAGVGYFTNSIEHTGEFRTWEQYQNTAQIKNVILINRARLEQRLKNGESDFGHRLRYMIRTHIPTSLTSDWSVVLYDEVFVGLNKNESQRNLGFDQNRLFVGFRKNLDDYGYAEMGIMNQLTNDEVYNIPMLTLGRVFNKKMRRSKAKTIY